MQPDDWLHPWYSDWVVVEKLVDATWHREFVARGSDLTALHELFGNVLKLGPPPREPVEVSPFDL